MSGIAAVNAKLVRRATALDLMGGSLENTVPKFNQLERRDAVDTRHPSLL